MFIRILSVASAMASAANAFLIAYPKDSIPDLVLILVGMAAASLAAGAAVLVSSQQSVQRLLGSLRQ